MLCVRPYPFEVFDNVEQHFCCVCGHTRLKRLPMWHSIYAVSAHSPPDQDFVNFFPNRNEIGLDEALINKQE